MCYFFHFSRFFWMKFRIKMIDCYIFSELRFLFEIQTNPFLAAQMALPSSFFQMFIGLGMYNFGSGKNWAKMVFDDAVLTVRNMQFTVQFINSKYICIYEAEILFYFIWNRFKVFLKNSKLEYVSKFKIVMLNKN